MELLWTDGLLEVAESGRVLEENITADKAAYEYGPIRIVSRPERLRNDLESDRNQEDERR